jgi:hypothetical protein
MGVFPDRDDRLAPSAILAALAAFFVYRLRFRDARAARRQRKKAPQNYVACLDLCSHGYHKSWYKSKQNLAAGGPDF